ncbi:MAG TPA: VOC family protein [Candidatus Limnocylindria bacterium]|nr:VOC family protein [Candidatus Limnocylindria bacterium]
MDHVTVVVDDLDAAIAFFTELGMDLRGQASVQGPWVDELAGLDNVRADIAMMRMPDGSGQIELTRYNAPPALAPVPEIAPPNTLGIRQIMFEVDDLDAVVARLEEGGGERIGEIVQYEDQNRLCYVRGPEGMIIALAEQIG